jgi:hypothetical protein
MRFIGCQALSPATSSVGDAGGDSSPFLRPRVGGDDAGPLVRIAHENPWTARATGSACDPVLPEELGVALEPFEVSAHVREVDRGVGHELVEAVHELGLREHRQLVKGFPLQPGVEPAVERRVHVSMPAQPLGFGGAMSCDALGAPALPRPQLLAHR